MYLTGHLWAGALFPDVENLDNVVVEQQYYSAIYGSRRDLL